MRAVRASAGACLAWLLLTSAAAAAVPSVTIVAGGGSTPPQDVRLTPPYTSSTGLALLGPSGLAPDGGYLLLTDDSGARVFQVTPLGVAVPIAGTGVPAAANGSCPSPNATDGQLHAPTDSVLFGSVYLIADNSHICSANTATGAGTILTGGAPGYANGTVGAQFHDPVDLEPFAGATPGFFVADLLNHAVRKYVDPNVTTVAGAPGNTVPPAEPGDAGFPSTATAVDIGYPHSVSAIDETTFFIANEFQVLRVSGGTIQRVAGGGNQAPAAGLAATSAQLGVGGIQALHDGGGLLTSVDGHLYRVLASGNISTFLDIVPQAARVALSDHALYVLQQSTVSQILATEIASGPGQYSGSSTARLTYTSWDENATFACELDNAPIYSVCAGEYPGLTEGKHTLRVQATTDGGTRVDTPATTRIWKVDLTPPASFDLLGPADGQTSTDPKPAFSWTPTTDPNATAGAGLASYELWIDGAKAASVTPDACATSCTASPPSALADGAHTWEVRALDGVGNTRAAGPRAVTISAPPTAALTVAPARALVGRTVSFDAGASSDSNGSIARYEWDLDGNGSYETDTGGASTTTKSYPAPATLQVGVRVTDSGGLTGDARTELVVTATPPAGKPLGVSINDGAQYTNDPNVTIFAVWPSFASTELLSNDGGFKLAQASPVAEKLAWKLDSSGPERLPKTIYVRFSGGAQTSETFQDDIILDQTPPKVDQAAVAPVAGSAAVRAAKLATWAVKVKATDSNSGVASLQMTANKKKPGPFVKYKRSLKVRSARRPKFIRARDRAGNLSPWRAAKNR